MATHLENFISIMTGVLDAAPSNVQMTAVADSALAKVTDSELLGLFPNATRETLNPNQRALIANIIIRKLIRRMVRFEKVKTVNIANKPAMDAAANDETI